MWWRVAILLVTSAVPASAAPPEEPLDAGALPVLLDDLQPAKKPSLVASRVEVDVVGPFAHMTVSRTFRLLSPLFEGHLALQPPPGAQIDALRVRYGDGWIDAAVRQAAADAPTSDGCRSDALRPLQLAVRDLPAGTEVEVVMGSFERLPCEDGWCSLAVPLGAPLDAPPDLSVRLAPVRVVRSPTHRIDARREGATITVRLAGPAVSPLRLRFELEPEGAVAGKVGDDAVVAVVVQPDLPSGAPMAVAVVIDTATDPGTRAVAAVAARHIARRLGPRDTFAARGLESRNALTRVTPAGLAAERSAVCAANEGGDADYRHTMVRGGGGTPLIAVPRSGRLAPPHSAGAPWHVVLLTAATDSAAVAALVRDAGDVGPDTRVSVVGLGAARPAALRAIAAAGGGEWAHASTAREAPAAADRVLRGVTPGFGGASVEWGTLQDRTAPLGDVRAGQPLVAMGRISPAATGRVQVSGVSGWAGGPRVAYDVRVDGRSGPSSDALTAAWASWRTDQRDLGFGAPGGDGAPGPGLGVASGGSRVELLATPRAMPGGAEAAARAAATIGHGEGAIDAATLSGRWIRSATADVASGVERRVRIICAVPDSWYRRGPAALDAVLVARVLADRRAAVRAVWQPYVQRDPSRTGRVVLRLAIDRAGTVQETAVVADELGLPDLSAGLVRVARATRFPQSAAGGVVTWPLLLRVGAVRPAREGPPPRLRAPRAPTPDRIAAMTAAP